MRFGDSRVGTHANDNCTKGQGLVSFCRKELDTSTCCAICSCRRLRCTAKEGSIPIDRTAGPLRVRWAIVVYGFPMVYDKQLTAVIWSFAILSSSILLQFDVASQLNINTFAQSRDTYCPVFRWPRPVTSNDKALWVAYDSRNFPRIALERSTFWGKERCTQVQHPSTAYVGS